MPYPTKLTREDIVATASALLEEGGVDALTMRPLSQRLGVQASSLYRHFGSREALLETLAEGAAGQLNAALSAVRGTDARQTLRDAARAYLTFAAEHPHLYALLLTPQPQLTPTEMAASEGKALWNTLLRLVGQLSGNPDDTAWAVAYWTFLHGYAELSRSGIYGASGPKGGFELGLEALLDGMQHRRA